MIRVAMGVAAAVLCAGPVAADTYGPWTTNKEKNRHECVYTYATKDGKTSTQTVVAYTAADKDRHGWAYFYNAEGKPWGRCATPANPKYDAKQMYWQKLTAAGDGYEDYPTKGFCPAPKDGKSPIPSLPDPPK